MSQLIINDLNWDHKLLVVRNVCTIELEGNKFCVTSQFGKHEGDIFQTTLDRYGMHFGNVYFSCTNKYEALNINYFCLHTHAFHEMLKVAEAYKDLMLQKAINKHTINVGPLGIKRILDNGPVTLMYNNESITGIFECVKLEKIVWFLDQNKRYTIMIQESDTFIEDRLEKINFGADFWNTKVLYMVNSELVSILNFMNHAV